MFLISSTVLQRYVQDQIFQILPSPLRQANLKFLLALPSRMATSSAFSQSPFDVLDIRREDLDGSLLKLMLKCLDPDDNGARTLPTLILYDGRSNHAADRTLQLIWEQRLV